MVLKIPKIPNLPPAFSKALAYFSPPKAEETAPQSVLGINIGRKNIVLSEVSAGPDNKLILERCVQNPIIPDKPAGPQIKAMLQGLQITTKTARMSLKGQGVVVRYLSFPRMSRADFASSIQFEAEKYLPFSLAEVVLDYHIMEDVSSGKAGADAMKVILAAARKAEVDRLLDVAHDAGLKLQIIDLDVFAVVNAFSNSSPVQPQGTIALFDFGALDSSLAILNKGNLVFSRDVAFGGNDFAEALRRKLNISLEEARKIQCGPALSDPSMATAAEEALDKLFQELSSSLTYYYDQYQDADQIGAIYLSGGFSQLSILSPLLEKRVGAPVKYWDPTAGLVLGKNIDQEKIKALNPYLPVSIGLAIRQK